MTINSAVLDYRIPMIGETAHKCLSQAHHGKVLASFSQAAYLLTEGGELVWITSSQSARHRRNIQSSLKFPRPLANSTFTIQDQSIILDSGLELIFSGSHIWQGSSLPSLDVIEINEIPEKLLPVFERISTWNQSAGIGSFIQPILQIAGREEPSIFFQPYDILNRKTWSIIKKITTACKAHDFNKVLKYARSLVGLGEGLTPCGDDFIGGLLFARHLLLCNYPDLNYLKSKSIHTWIEATKPRTNLISYVLLKDNVNGYALEPLTQLGVAILTGQSLEDTCSAAAELIEVGQSTGWSMLTGFLAGMLLVIND
ncbi:DUF2877 domain-containing protein [Chloroflexota bacterium]